MGNNWATLQAFVTKAQASDVSLAKKTARFAESFSRRQKRETERILSRPESKAYKDYILTPV
jgi:hypothetical protein